MGKQVPGATPAKPYGNLTLQQLQDARAKAVTDQASSGHNAGDFQSRINSIDSLIKAYNAPKPVTKAVAAAPAAVPAAVKPTDMSAFNQQWTQVVPTPPVATPEEVKVAALKADELAPVGVQTSTGQPSQVQQQSALDTEAARRAGG
jgi:hypothetical protein